MANLATGRCPNDAIYRDECRKRIHSITDGGGVQSCYRWAWHQRSEAGKTAKTVNEKLKLVGPEELQPDSLCLSVGSLQGLVILAANPGFDAEFNQSENTYCLESCGNYLEMSRDFFDIHPRVTGRHARWWTRAMRASPILTNWGSTHRRSVGAQHAHLLARFGARPIRTTVGRLKSMMTRAIKSTDASSDPKRTWSKGCHPRSCKNRRDYGNKFRYVIRHRDERAVVHVWPNVIVTPDQFT
jgi:hypothetical protein